VRPRAYPGTQFFVLCFALNDRQSLTNVISIWMKEISQFCENAAIILVGTKFDDRTLTEKEISVYRKIIHPRYYIETSAKTGENVQDLFHTIALLVASPETVPGTAIDDESEISPVEKKNESDNPVSSSCLLL
jgi:GTPase SAR1 family protein